MAGPGTGSTVLISMGFPSLKAIPSTNAKRFRESRPLYLPINAVVVTIELFAFNPF
jgi:hypothetical protein